MASHFYHLALPIRTLPIRTVLFQQLERFFIFSSVQIEILRKPDLNLRSSQPITGLSRPALCFIFLFLKTYHCSYSASLFFSWRSLRISSWTVSYFSCILLLYHASSLSRISRKFLSSGRLNCSHSISPGSFSWTSLIGCKLYSGSLPTWRTNFLPSPPPVLPHNTASTKGFSSSCSLLSLNRDKDLLRGKLKEIFSFFLVKRIHTCHPCNRPASHTGHTCAGCQPHGTFEAELWSHPVKVAWRHCLLLMRGCMGVNTQLVVNNWLIDLCCGLTCDV